MPRKVFLAPKLNPQAYKGSRQHTAYIGSSIAAPPGIPQPLYRLEFINGQATNVDEAVYERFKDAGLVDVNRPKRQRREDEEDEEGT